jgi:phospholipid/cholesterol/gamma-HCH transport system permease protein
VEPASTSPAPPLTRPYAAAWARRLGALLAAPAEARAPVRLDLSGVEAVDSAGGALLADFARQAATQRRPIDLIGVGEQVARTLQLFACPSDRLTEPAPPKVGALEGFGGRLERTADWLRDYLQLCADVVYFAAAGLRRPASLRWDAVLENMVSMGSQAAGVVVLIAFLVGGTIALQSAEQLRQFGANLFVADLIGVSITRELGPLITAIVVAGRSGASVAAELGTMTVSEEIDALRTMGIDPVRYVLAPKLWALCLTQPILSALASGVAIAGGGLVATTYLEVSPGAFCDRLQVALMPKDIATGLFKSGLFAGLIVTLGAAFGLRTRGGADAVGRSTTAAVVASIFAIITADALCSLLFYFGD